MHERNWGGGGVLQLKHLSENSRVCAVVSTNFTNALRFIPAKIDESISGLKPQSHDCYFSSILGKETFCYLIFVVEKLFVFIHFVLLGFKSLQYCKDNMVTFSAFTAGVRHRVPFCALFHRSKKNPHCRGLIKGTFPSKIASFFSPVLF